MPVSAQEQLSRPEGGVRGLWTGMALWCAFSVAAVLLKGPQWDETYEQAQALLGEPAYPAGHPFGVYVHNAYTIQVYLSALILQLGGGAALLCGIRNVLFLKATVLPPFLLGTLATRRVLWGHIAVVLILVGIHLDFDSTYPQFVWPGVHSNGHIPLGVSLIALGLIAAGYFRSGAFLTGLMPMLHLGQAPPLFLFAGVFGLWLIHRGDWAGLGKGAAGLAAGLACCAALWLIQRVFVVPIANSGPYHSPVDIEQLWRVYTFYYDYHRGAPVTGNSHIGLAAMLLVGAGLALHEHNRGRSPGPWTWMLVYAACVAAIVWPIFVAHSLLGDRTPYLFVSWLPYRLMNHVPVLLVVALTGALTVPDDSQTRWPGLLVLAGALLYLLFRPLFEGFLPETLYSRYVISGELVFYGLLGAALYRVNRSLRATPRAVRTWRGVTGLGWLGLCVAHQFGAACVAGGALLAFLLTLRGGIRHDQRLAVWATRLTVGAGLLLVAAMLCGQLGQRDPLPTTAFDRDVTQYLIQQNEQGALIAGPPDMLLLHARTGHPVMTPTAVQEWISYMTSIGPATHAILKEVYGIRYDLPPSETDNDWQRVWRERPEKRWGELGRRFNFRYVVAPQAAAPGLPLALSRDGWQLHEVPRPVP